MTAHTTKTKAIPVRRPPTGRPFQPGAAARAAQAAAVRSRRAAQAPAQPAAQPAPQAPAQPAERLGVPPAQYIDAARVVGLERAAVVAPPSASIEIERVAPAWAAGYCEVVTPAQIAPQGTMREYLRQKWGGGVYACKVRDVDGKAWEADRLPIAGPPLYEGAPLAPPLPAPVPATNPVAALGAEVRGALDEMNRRIGSLISGGARGAVAGVPNPPASAAAGPAGRPDLGQQLADELESWQRTTDRIKSAIGRAASTVQPNPAPAKDDDDGSEDDQDADGPPEKRPIGDRIADIGDEYLRRFLDRSFPEAARPAGTMRHGVGPPSGSAATGAAAAPAGTVPAERMTE